MGNNTNSGLLPCRQLQGMTRLSLQGRVPGYLYPVSAAGLRGSWGSSRFLWRPQVHYKNKRHHLYPVIHSPIHSYSLSQGTVGLTNLGSSYI